MKNELLQAKWADHNNGQLSINTKPRVFEMANSQGTGEPLFAHNGFGADIIQFDAGKGVNTHTHDGDHILFVLSGEGSVEYFDEQYPLYPGMAYFIPGDAPHAISAHCNLVLIAVGNDHHPVNSEQRLNVNSFDNAPKV